MRLPHAFLIATSLALSACSPRPPEAGRRIVYEVEPAHAAEVAAVLQARLGPGTGVRQVEGGRVHVEIRVEDDEARVRRIAEARGRLRLLLGADEGHEPPGGSDAAFDALAAWCREHPSQPVTDAPPPAEGFVWGVLREVPGVAPLAERATLLLNPKGAKWSFGTEDVASVRQTEDKHGHRALGIEIRADRVNDLAAFTEVDSERLLIVALDGAILVMTVIHGPLSGSFEITGTAPEFSEEDVDVYVRVLRHGMLPAPVRYVETRSFP